MISADLHSGWAQLTAKLRAFVARRVPASDADDVVQSALLRIQRSLPDLRDDQRFGPWVYRVTRTAIADHLRKETRANDRLEQLSEEPFETSSDEDDLTPQLVGCLSIFVAELPSPYREAIMLTELDGLSQKEAAEMTGVSVSGMKSRVQRGRARLRAMFDLCCELTQDARGHVIECESRSACRSNGCAAPDSDLT